MYKPIDEEQGHSKAGYFIHLDSNNKSNRNVSQHNRSNNKKLFNNQDEARFANLDPRANSQSQKYDFYEQTNHLLSQYEENGFSRSHKLNSKYANFSEVNIEKIEKLY